ncbi:YphA family membrane protein [Rossellomorea marisflavi]|uniref:YphA family membrane protein n=1 Tax=Rossellomorea marisflavi TaxID=189381 RepID=UPI00348C5494
MEGIYYLWILWGVWVYSTFLMKKGRVRFWISFCTLVLVASFPYEFGMGHYRVTVPLVLIVLLALWTIRELPLRKKLYLFISLISTAMCLTGVKLVSIYDPVLVIVDPFILDVSVLIVMGFLFYSDVASGSVRYASVLLGGALGQVFIGMILTTIGFGHTIGEHKYMDAAAVSFLILVGIDGLLFINRLFNAKLQENKGDAHHL